MFSLRRGLALAVAMMSFAGAADAQYVIRIPYGNSVTAKASFALSPSTLAFGEVAFTSNDTKVVTLSNGGDAEGDVSIETPSSPFSSSHNCPATLAAAASCQITVTFTPGEIQSFSQTIDVAGQDLPITGEGVAVIVSDVLVSDASVYVKKSDGSWWVGGRNQYGQLGLGDKDSRLELTRNHAFDGAVQVRSGFGRALVQFGDGNWYAVGTNMSGGLGLGATTDVSSPTRVPALDGATNVELGLDYTIARRADGTWIGAGSSSAGRLGVMGLVNTQTSFIDIPLLNGAVKVSLGNTHGFAKYGDGTWALTGQGTGYRLGTGQTTDRTIWSGVPVQVQGATDIIALNNNTFAKNADGTWWVSGTNSFRQGLQNSLTTLQYFTAMNMLDSTQIADLDSNGNNTIVRLTNGNWVGVGQNSNGELAVGDKTARTDVTALPELAGARKVVLRGWAIYVIKADGTLWVAGNNTWGQLVTGDNTERLVLTPAVFAE